MEEWCPVVDFEGLYEISNYGNVRSLTRVVRGTHPATGYVYERLLTGQPMRSHLRAGYPATRLARGGKQYHLDVHCLVVAAFTGPRPDGLQVRHLDGNRRNPRLENLCYGTPSENAADALRHGTHPIGVRHGNAKLNPEAVRTIRAMKGVQTREAIARQFGAAADRAAGEPVVPVTAVVIALQRFDVRV